MDQIIVVTFVGTPDDTTKTFDLGFQFGVTLPRPAFFGAMVDKSDTVGEHGKLVTNPVVMLRQSRSSVQLIVVHPATILGTLVIVFEDGVMECLSVFHVRSRMSCAFS